MRAALVLRAAGVAAGLTLILGACTLLTGVGDLQEVALGDSGDVADVADVGVDAPVDVTLDARTDGPTDAGGEATQEAAPRDAPADAGGEAPQDAPTLRYCQTLAPQPLFCDDFDVGMLGATWDLASTLGGAMALDPFAQSPPDSALVTVPATSVNFIEVYLAKGFSSALGNGTFAFDLNADTIDATVNYPKLATILLGGGGGIYLQEVAGTPDLDVSDLLADGGYNYLDWVLPPFPSSPWTRISIATTALATGGVDSVTVSYNGSVVLQTGSLHAPSVHGKPTIRVGVFDVPPPTTAWKVRYDNVVFDMQ